MNILVIGNGFDLAHGLPTSYRDFLKFTEKVKEKIKAEKYATVDVNTTLMEKLILQSFNELLPDKLSAIKNVKIDNYIEAFERFMREDQENFWRKYFIGKKDSIGNRWVDFEQEIANAVNDLEHDLTPGMDHSVEVSPTPKPNWFFLEKNEIIYDLENDLFELNKSLEMYILLVSAIEIRPVRGLQEEIRKADYIINFNYTDTYERYFIRRNGKKITSFALEFVHGKAGDENIILGAGETLTGDAINTELSCVKFKKYFQRIHNRTGGKYRDFMNDEKSKIWNANGFLPNTNIHIYGHSLDVTDRDILSYVILHECTKKVTIYYYKNNEKSDYATSIINLIQVIGKEELTARVGDGRIEFISTEDLGGKSEKAIV